MAAKPKTTTTMSIIDEVRTLQARADAKRSEAIESLLAQKKEIERNLQVLGWVPPHGTNAGRTRRTKPVGQRFCKICKATGSHDARAHKRQGSKKRPFTAEELEGL